MELSPDARAPGQATLLPVHLCHSVGLGTTSTPIRGSHAGLAPLARPPPGVPAGKNDIYTGIPFVQKPSHIQNTQNSSPVYGPSLPFIIPVAKSHSRRKRLFPLQCTLPVAMNYSRRNRSFPSQRVIAVARDYSRRNALFPSQSIIPVAKDHFRRE